ncbi:Stress responsive A/B Barrel Domain [Thermus arciformis]|uniref:Stress responsive A/B Barrel Domain n=1 Tax=Thermus arciformis TaxID=482827 RepID=A0A1G7IYM1_9DEIN|nr:Dabb family protein [Thermus arciformis]SDF17399.1 Stress responsive A/B Barrel Domain [Thermus arciformis]
MVEHLIVFNAEASPEEVREMVRKAQEVLLQIPGVCGLRYGEALSPEARYRYWLSVLFEGPEVVAFYRDHPLHVAFADGVFRPMARDRITADYLVVTEVLCGT